MPLLEILNLNHNQISDIDNNNDTTQEANSTISNTVSIWQNFPFIVELYLAFNKIDTIHTFNTIRYHAVSTY